MSDIQEKLNEELDKLAEDEFSPKNELKERTYDAAKRRLDRDTIGRIAVLVSFMATIFFGMAISYLNEQKVLTAEGAMLIIGGGLIYVAFRMFVLVYNYLFAKLQRVAIDLDIKEAEVRRFEAKTDAMKAESDAVDAQNRSAIEREKLRFVKEQNRLDKKLHQDLELRVPFFQEAQKSMMKFFARDDIVEALQVPPTFTDAVERLDDILLKRTEMNVTVDKINQRLNEVMISYTDMCQQTNINNELLNQMHTQNAEIMTKWRETDLGLKALQNQVDAIGNSMKSLMEILASSTPEGDKKIIEVDVKMKKPLSLKSELESLVKKEEEKEKEGELKPPPD